MPSRAWMLTPWLGAVAVEVGREPAAGETAREQRVGQIHLQLDIAHAAGDSPGAGSRDPDCPAARRDRTNGMRPSGMVIGSLLSTTLWTLAMPRPDDGHADHADGEDAQGAEQDLQPEVAHRFGLRPAGQATCLNVPTRDAQTQGKVSVIEVEGLQKVYGDLAAVQDLSFQVQPGEVLGLVGPERRRQDHDPALPGRDHGPDPGPDPGRGARPGRGPGRGQVRPGVRSRRAPPVRVPHGRGAPPLRRPALPGRPTSRPGSPACSRSWSWATGGRRCPRSCRGA